MRTVLSMHVWASRKAKMAGGALYSAVEGAEVGDIGAGNIDVKVYMVCILGESMTAGIKE